MHLKIHIDLDSAQVRQHLLQGLDNWAQLGLLSDAQIQKIAARLSDPLPIPAASPPNDSNEAAIADSIITGTPDSASTTSLATEAHQPSANGLSWAIQSLLSEISVIWLLFLGVFLVVVSSGVLAASQWQSFSAVAQYAILFAYTLAFWGASVWTGGRSQLQTTAKMLSLATALLIPINLWMIDALGVFRSPAGIGFGLIAALTLSFIASRLLDSRINQLNLIGMSWLHLGWGTSLVLWPIAATYIGTISSAANLAYQDNRANLEPESVESGETKSIASSLFSFDALTIAIAIAILLFRSFFITQVPPQQLGLAAGVCGWLLAWLARNKTNRTFWDFAGYGLLLVGWLISYRQSPPWQAILVSGLALSTLWDRLKLHWRAEYLLALIGVACQTYWLLWFMLPNAARTGLLASLSQLTDRPINSDTWLSLGLFPFVLGLLFFARQLRLHQQNKSAVQTRYIALALGITLSVIGLGNHFTAAANLTISTITLVAVCRVWGVHWVATLTHGFGLLAIASCIHYWDPNFSLQQWTDVALGGAIAELFTHLFIRRDRWQQNFWFGSLGLFAISYGLIGTTDFQSSYRLWLIVPIALTFAANHRRALHPQAAAASAIGTLLLQTPWLLMGRWEAALVSFATAALCTGLNSRIWRSLYTTLFTVGAILAFVNTLLLYGLEQLPNIDRGWLLVCGAIEIYALWLMPRFVLDKEGLLPLLYRSACLRWSYFLLGLFVLCETFIATMSFWLPSNMADSLNYPTFAAVLLAAALIESIRFRPTEWRYWVLGWMVGLIAVFTAVQASGEAVGYIGSAIALLVLGATAQIAGDIWAKKHPGYRSSWHGVPLLYTIVGAWLGHLYPAAATGLYTIAAAVVFIGIGRRATKLNVLSYLGLLAFSIGAYELLIYRLSQASGGSPGDGIILLAALALAIALVEKWFSPWLQRYLKLSDAALQNTAHLHWALGSLLGVLALFAGLSQPIGTAIWTTISLLLASYALSIGNRLWTPQLAIANHVAWTSVGLLEILLCLAFSRFELFLDRAILLTWAGVIACVVSLTVYRLPWARWGWPRRPFGLLSIWLPILTIGTTILQVSIPGLLIVSAFYAWIAKAYSHIRISYLGIFLLDWAILDYLNSQSLLTELWFALIAGLSILYVAQVDPYFKEIQQRQQRHILRVLTSASVALTALYQAEVSEPMLLFAGLTLVLCIAFIFAGLMLKVRAFLYVGTITFVAQIIRILWIFISTYSLLLWAVGIVLGLAFIWIAATFESRRSQVTTLLNTWTSALNAWD